LAKLKHFELLGQLQDFHETLRQQRFVFPAESANRIVVRACRQQQPPGTLCGCALLDAPQAKRAGGVAVNEQGQHHRGGYCSEPGARSLTLAWWQASAATASRRSETSDRRGTQSADWRQEQRGVAVNGN